MTDAYQRKKQYEADKSRRVVAEGKDVFVPQCEDMEWRLLLEDDDVEWLQFFFGEDCVNPFWYGFTSQQIEMIRAIRQAVLHGGDQAIAASRGEGKTTLTERLILKYTLQGVVSFSVLFSATGGSAENSLDSIKSDITENERLAAYYPEVCVPVRALENTPNRAHYQTVSGSRIDNGETFERAPSKFTWCGHEIVFPNVPGSPSAQAVIATRGLDAAVRGLKKKGKRPQLAVIDDPDTEETARSEEQAKKLEDRIDKGIGGLGGQQRGIARVMLTTLQSRISASFKFTDPKAKPTWKGRRFRYLITPPKRTDLWEEYVSQRQADMQAGDEFSRTAHKFYLDHRTEMDEGAVVANPNRYDGTTLPDGSQMEVSSLQRYFNEVSRIGAAAVATEFDNDPPEESGPVESGITPHRVQRQLSGFPRQTIPEHCIALTQGIDVRKTALHWVVRAWLADGTGYTIDYGVHEVHGTIYGSDEGVDVAVKRSILARIESFRDARYMTAGGELITDPLTLVDAGWRTDAVYAACAEAGVGVMPVMGFGRSSGCTQANFSDVQRRSQDKRPGDGWFLSRRGRIWLVCADADRWKAYEHDRWMTAPDKPGCMYLFGAPGDPGGRLSDDEKGHHSYSRHICNEVETEVIEKGTVKRRWKAKSENTHWLDASYYACVAANIRGVRLQMAATANPTKSIPTVSQQAKPAPAERMTPQDMAKSVIRPSPQQRMTPQQMAARGRS